MRLFTSATFEPDPAAIRALRDPLRIFGSFRSAGVIDWMMAATRSSSRSSTWSSWAFMSPMPGSMPMSLPIEPIFLTACICSRKSSRVKSSPWATFAEKRSALSASNARSACSISDMRSPMSRIRDAMRSGWKTSKSSIFSPVDPNMIGRPTTETIDKAAPPRASPSSFVRTTASKPTWRSNSSAVFTAS